MFCNIFYPVESINVYLLQALIDEDRLLSRLEVLENQLHTYSKVIAFPGILEVSTFNWLVHLEITFT